MYYFVYILKCSDGSYYIGQTEDVKKRLAEHQNNSVEGYVSSRLPVTLVFNMPFQTRNEAFFTERKLKGWSRKKKEALINGDFNLLKYHAKKKFDY